MSASNCIRNFGNIFFKIRGTCVLTQPLLIDIVFARCECILASCVCKFLCNKFYRLFVVLTSGCLSVVRSVYPGQEQRADRSKSCNIKTA